MTYKEYLVNDVVPFWLDNALDEEYGGIFTSLDKDGNIYGTDKSVWFQGRALWVFSKLYNCVEKNEAYLNAAKTIYRFLPTCTDTDGRMFFSVTREGKELQKRRYYFSETFAAIGLAELYKATGDAKILEEAETYFQVAYECFTGKRPLAPKFNPENSKMKALSPVMIMLATTQVMRSIPGLKEKYAPIAKACLDEILHGGFLTEKALLESVSLDKQPVDSPTGRVVNPGHSLEAAWFIMAEGLLTDNQEAIDLGQKIIDITLPLGWDKEHGGIIAFTDVDKKPPVQLEWDMKLWWPQCEAMIATRLAYLISGKEQYNETYLALKAYTEKYFYDTDAGEWYGYLHYDNTPSTTLKGNLFKGPFHIPRMLMIMACMDETGGILSFMQ